MLLIIVAKAVLNKARALGATVSIQIWSIACEAASCPRRRRDLDVRRCITGG